MSSTHTASIRTVEDLVDYIDTALSRRAGNLPGFAHEAMRQAKSLGLPREVVSEASRVQKLAKELDEAVGQLIISIATADSKQASTLRGDLLRLASELPPGDPSRKKLLAALKH